MATCAGIDEVGSAKECTDAVQELLRPINDAGGFFAGVFALALACGFVVGPIAVFVMRFALDLRWGASAVWGLSTTAGFWIVATAAMRGMDAAKARAADRAATAFSDQFPPGSDRRGQAIALLASEIDDEITKAIEAATQSGRPPVISSTALLLMAAQPAFAEALHRCGSVSDDEFRTMEGIVPRAQERLDAIEEDGSRKPSPEERAREEAKRSIFLTRLLRIQDFSHIHPYLQCLVVGLEVSLLAGTVLSVGGALFFFFHSLARPGAGLFKLPEDLAGLAAFAYSLPFALATVGGIIMGFVDGEFWRGYLCCESCRKWYTSLTFLRYRCGICPRCGSSWFMYPIKQSEEATWKAEGVGLTAIHDYKYRIVHRQTLRNAEDALYILWRDAPFGWWDSGESQDRVPDEGNGTELHTQNEQTTSEPERRDPQ